MLGPDKLCPGVVVAVIALLFVPPAIAQKDNSTQVLPPQYQNWLDQDVLYIITDQERAEFAKLTNDRQREEFVNRFWDRRNPDPESKTNAFKQEHYRRLAYANTHFAHNVPGYESDRGRIYIIYGPPEEREQHPMRSRLVPASATASSRYPSEVWLYHYIEGVGRNVVMQFIDTCECGEYPLVNDPTKKY
jgi:GWxTD domain-containing protein